MNTGSPVLTLEVLKNINRCISEGFEYTELIQYYNPTLVDYLFKLREDIKNESWIN